MRNLIIHTIATYIGILITYLMFCFVYLNFDVFSWDEKVRLIMVFIAIIICSIANGIAYEIRESL